MKALITIAILLTLALVALMFRRSGDWKKLFISLALFALILILSGLGAMTRTIIPLFIAHFILILIAWGSLIYYIFKDKLYWYIITAPSITILLFILLEHLVGSGG